MTKQKETVLTVDELKKMGDMISDIKETLEFYNHALEFVPGITELNQNDKEDVITRYRSLSELNKTMFYKNQQLINGLNDIGYMLHENDEAGEIESTRKKFN